MEKVNISIIEHKECKFQNVDLCFKNVCGLYALNIYHNTPKGDWLVYETLAYLIFSAN